ncbi:BTAD domain-containing putative transcriptional regulator [Streptomyces sp. SP17BM10]|uniref:AfsR/SARP family transcriptional regulator n=1 Tax=Streptomyces sp. SP17BM10 TaxID=3002530 RepID=UPI002E76BC4A|nr:BTAD domain-containing putative transcriptional regulator [Streptomyces sp. SP17BM10]MEE1784676.1 BTAD domain-containing putative transcriptional regulator [Streptomyces sp. SP17BM10]
MRTKTVSAPEWEFGVLGPLLVRQGPSVVRIGAEKQRAVLALLLLRANRTVTLAELEDRLWGDRPPNGARNAVQSYVYRLRQLMPPKHGPVLRTEIDGYSVRVPEQALDLHRFEDLAEKGRQAVRAGFPEDGHARLRDALAQWRGPAALADVPVPAVQAEAHRLAELRLRVAEDAMDVGLELGRHRELLEQITALAEAQPYRERLWGQLMLALARSGRRAEALGAFSRLRVRLRDDLGIEPTRETLRLQQSILAGTIPVPGAHVQTVVSAGLPAPAPAPAPPAAGGPGPAAAPAGTTELPAETADFVGRGAELAAIRQWLLQWSERRGPLRPAVLSGPPGVGKSALAVRAAHQLAEHFPDGQLYADLHRAAGEQGEDVPLQVLSRWLRSLGADHVPQRLEEASALFRSMLVRRRVLVVVDGASNAEQVSPLLPGSGWCAALVTSHVAMTVLDNALHVPIGTPEEDDMVELLRRHVGAQRVDADLTAARAVVRLCDRTPLAVRIAAARLAARPLLTPRMLAARLEPRPTRLAELSIGGRSVGDRIGAAARSITGQFGAELFRILGRHPWIDTVGMTAAEVADACDWPRPQAETALEALEDVHLVTLQEDGRYLMPTLARLCAAELPASVG